MPILVRRRVTRSDPKSVRFRPRLESLEGRTVPSSYTATELGTLGGPVSEAAAINNAGQIAGSGMNATSAFHAVLYQDGSKTDLGTLSGNQSYAQAINSQGQIVGYAGYSSTSGAVDAFLWTAGGTDGVPTNPQMKDLGTLGGTTSIAYGINDAGQVVGESGIAGDAAIHAFLFQNGKMTDLGTFGGTVDYSYAYGINNAGQIVGYSFTSGEARPHAFLVTPEDSDGDGRPDLWFRDNDANGSNDLMTDLGTLGGSESVANGINDAGQIVGTSSTTIGDSTSQAFLWTKGGTDGVVSNPQMKDIGVIDGFQNSTAVGINAKGQVVGYAYVTTTGDPTDHAFVYRNSGITDLTEDSGWIQGSALAINANGLIVGAGTNPSGANLGLLLTPLPDIVATKLAFNSLQGGVDFQYEVTGASLPTDSIASLYWATGPARADILGPAAASPIAMSSTTPLDTIITAHVAAADLLEPVPVGATFLLAVVDPDNQIAEADESNNGQSLAIVPDIVVDSVSTMDSRSLIVSYHVDLGPIPKAFNISFYRSATPTFEPLSNNVLLGSIQVAAGADGTGNPSKAIPGGLPPDTARPYVLAVADPGGTIGEATTANNTASFRTYVIGAVVPGFAPSAWSQYSTPPEWATDMANALQTVDGYRTVEAFRWASGSPIPNAIIVAGQALFTEIESDAEAIPGLRSNDVIDVHLIGHSRGTVVISEVAQHMLDNLGVVPQMDHGYLKMTLLDPHPANNTYGYNGDFAALFGGNFLHLYQAFQFLVHDPAVVVPARVNEVNDFYEDTTCIKIAPSTNLEESFFGFGNLHGLAPSKIKVQNLTQTEVFSENLTGPNLGHGEVPGWYMRILVANGDLGHNVVPSDVHRLLPTVTVAASPKSSAFGQPATLIATVRRGALSGALSRGAPSGSVTFMDDETVLGTAELKHGKAVFRTAALEVGSHAITAVYSGDSQYPEATSLVGDRIIKQASTTTSVRSSSKSSSFGQTVTFTATVGTRRRGSGIPTGIVFFLDGTTVLGNEQLTDGVAVYQSAALNVGTHSITAIYVGDGNFLPSAARRLRHTVKQSGAAAILSASGTPSTLTETEKMMRVIDFFTPSLWTPDLLEAFDFVRGRERV